MQGAGMEGWMAGEEGCRLEGWMAGRMEGYGWKMKGWKGTSRSVLEKFCASERMRHVEPIEPRS